MLLTELFAFGILLCVFQPIAAGRIKRAHEVVANANNTAEQNVTIAKHVDEKDVDKHVSGNATAVVSEFLIANNTNNAQMHCDNNNTNNNNNTNAITNTNNSAVVESRARIARHLTEAFNRRKQMRTKYHDERQIGRRSLDHETECKKHKARRARRKPLNLDIKDEELTMMPYGEIESWEHEHELPDRRRSVGIVEHGIDESPLGVDDGLINDNVMPESSALNMISLAHLLLGKHNAHTQEVQTHYKEPYGGYDAEEITYVVDKPESKLASFLRNARAVGLMEPKSKPYEIMSSNAASAVGEDEELEIRCPIHHGPGMTNIVGMCSCNIVKNKPEFEQLPFI